MKHRLILAGGSGFLGQALAAHFKSAHWEIVVLTRSPGSRSDGVKEVPWDAGTLGSWTGQLEGSDAVVNLTGKSVDCRYNSRNRKEILESRVHSTRVLGEAIGRCANPPPVWLNASTATVYKHTFGEPWDETGAMEPAAEAKDAFSVEVAKAWEAALEEARVPRTRKVALRMSLVLGNSTEQRFPGIRRLARLGLGERWEAGQYVSWIHVADYCRAVEWIINHGELTGSVNVAAPNPVPNREMMRLMRKICGAPLGLPATNWMLEVGAFFLRTETELIIKSRRVIPARLLKSDFCFEFPMLDAAFRNLADQAN